MPDRSKNRGSGYASGSRLMPGMTLAIEPMVNAGGSSVRILDDGWTVITDDSKASAHFEHTVLITSGDPEILTLRPREALPEMLACRLGKSRFAFKEPGRLAHAAATK